MTITTDTQYREVLARLTDLVERDPAPETDAGRELMALASILEKYEQRTWPSIIASEPSSG